MALIENIPKSLIYEMVNGNPVYYKGYKDYLNNVEKINELMPSSYLQALIVTQLIILLSRKLDEAKYQLISSEIGLQFDKKSWRAADLAIYEKVQLKDIPKHNKYLTIPPKVVIEVDTKAALEDITNPLNYYQEKTDELLAFGVEKVIWVFTDTEKVMIAESGKDWYIIDWAKDIQLMNDITFNIQQIVNAV